MLTAHADLGRATSRLWLCGDQALVTAGNAVQHAAKDVTETLTTRTSGPQRAELDLEKLMEPLTVSRFALAAEARRHLKADPLVFQMRESALGAVDSGRVG